MTLPLRVSPKLISVDRAGFRATVWRMKGNRYVVERAYQIAVGRAGHATPAGAYFVELKQRPPTWVPPNADWVPPDMVGKPVAPDDPHNPLRGAFIGLAGGEGIGFHGVPPEEEATLGTAASHGCLRMRVDGVLDLYRRVGLGTPVFIA